MTIIDNNIKFLRNENNAKLEKLHKVISKAVVHKSSNLQRNETMFKNDSDIRARKSINWLENFEKKKQDETTVFHIRDTNGNHDGYKKMGKEYLKNGKSKTVLVHMESFCDKTSLHGLKFSGDSSLSNGERIFWLLSFFCAMSFAVYFIVNIYEKYDNSPVIISYNPKVVPLLSIPFPAVTICNLNQALKSEAEKILTNGTAYEKRLLDDHCNSNTSISNVTEEENFTTNWKTLKQFILKINQPCNELLKVCFWKDNPINCSTLFTTYLTDDGMCCSFNRLPKPLLFRDTIDLDENISYVADDWTPERGYSPESSLNTTPWRAAGAGAHLGLTVVLDAAIEHYFCSSTNSVGFKVLLSNPIETPKMADFGFLVSPGVEGRIIIFPNINDATSTLKSIEVNKRQCFFPRERQLKFYRTYTERNCKLECQSNFTMKMCNCIPYYLPKGVNSTICGKFQEECSRQAKVIMETPKLTGLNCDCLPGCFELSYSKSASFAKLSHELKPDPNYLGDAEFDYFVKNMAILHFFYIDTFFRKFTKSEMYGFTEFLSNTGGLLGLFLGFSFLSLVEIGYYLSLKICCMYIRKRRKGKNDRNIYPFSK